VYFVYFGLAVALWRSPGLPAEESTAARSTQPLSSTAYVAFTAPFPRITVKRLRTKDGSAGGTRLKGEALRVCADLLGFGGAMEQLEGPDNGCFALARFRWDSQSEAFLVRGPGFYESNSKFLVVMQGPRIAARLEVASGMGDAGEEQVAESLIADFDADGTLEVLTRRRTTHDRRIEPTEPDTESYVLHSWKKDRFEDREVAKEDPLVAAFESDGSPGSSESPESATGGFHPTPRPSPR
jgi:hypothetical protein